MADRGGVIEHWDPGLEQFFGYTPDEAVGQRVELIIPPAFKSLHLSGFSRAMAKGKLKREDSEVELPALHKDGSIVRFHGTLALRRSEDGALEGAVATVFSTGPAWRATAWRIVMAPHALVR